MSKSKPPVSQAASDFHECVKNGSLEDIAAALKKGIDINIPGRNEETALMVAIAAQDLEKMKLLVDKGADPELTDAFNGTALQHAVSWDFTAEVEYLLSLGVDRGHHPKYPLKKVEYDFSELPVTPMPKELKGLMSEDEWRESIKEQWASIAETGQNPTVDPIIADVQSVEVLKLFLEVGEDLNDAPSEVKRSYIGLENKGDFQSILQDYLKHQSPRFGTRNPEPMDNPFWKDMVRLGGNAYAAREHFDNTGLENGPVWCYDRFGSTLTPLDDGRFVQIGGEHEDYYDPDFNIYNDVVVHDGKGNFEIFGYPKEVFPPTDFHTATRVGDSIYIIGCLGYPDQRAVGRTPVYRLEIETWKIESVNTSGQMPGWVHKHKATLNESKEAIRVEGGEILITGEDGEQQLVPNDLRHELDLKTLQWRAVE